MPVNLDTGSHVWVEDPELAWIDGIVLNINGDEAQVQTSDEKMVKENISKLYFIS